MKLKPVLKTEAETKTNYCETERETETIMVVSTPIKVV